MFRLRRSDTGTRRLDFGGGGGRGTEYLLAGALAVIIVGSLAFTLWNAFSGGGKPAVETEWHLKCLNPECGYEFVAKPEDLKGKVNEEMLSQDPAHMRLPCPKCGQVSAVRMEKCPNPDCGIYFVPELYKDPDGILESGKPIRFICPKCHTDVTEWRRKHRK